jgi:8-oxo-dGTP pyrophosphatase MutT (NUDIX family)
MREDVGIILLNKEDKILLQLRENSPDIEYPDHWVLFGGGIEEGERPEDALKRELLEEIELKLDRFRFLGNYHYKCQRKQHIFFSRYDLDVNKVKLHEGSGLRYFSKDELDEIRLGFNMREVLRDFFTKLKNGKIRA